jgi:hypothetical protein
MWYTGTSNKEEECTHSIITSNMLATADLPYLAFVFILYVHKTAPLSLCDSAK